MLFKVYWAGNTQGYLFNLSNFYWILSSYILALRHFRWHSLLPSSPTKTKDFGYEFFKVTTGEEASVVLAQLAICGRPHELLRDNALPFTLRSPVWVKQRLTVSKGCYHLVMAWELIWNKLLVSCVYLPEVAWFRLFEGPDPNLSCNGYSKWKPLCKDQMLNKP